MISNGRLGMSIGENEEMQVSLTRPSEEGENQGKLNQGILSLNPKQTYELLKKCGLAEDLDTGWNTKLFVCCILPRYNSWVDRITLLSR